MEVSQLSIEVENSSSEWLLNSLNKNIRKHKQSFRWCVEHMSNINKCLVEIVIDIIIYFSYYYRNLIIKEMVWKK